MEVDDLELNLRSRTADVARRPRQIYARKAHRTPYGAPTTSSPAKLASEADITLSEMSKRLLKRSRRGFVLSDPEQEPDKTTDDADGSQWGTLKKRRLESLVSTPTPERREDKDMEISSTLGGGLMEPSRISLSKPLLLPQPSSPEASVRFKGTRIFVPTISRKAKENATLGSPFHGRNNPNGLPESYTRKSRTALQPKLTSRTRSTASTRGQRTPNAALSNDPRIYRRPSGPASQQQRSPAPDWLVPAQSDLRIQDTEHISTVQTPSSFFADLPQACSTPFVFPRPPLADKILDTNVGPNGTSQVPLGANDEDVSMSEASVLPNSVLTIPFVLSTPPLPSRSFQHIPDNQEIIPVPPAGAHTPTLPRRHTQIHLSGDSIFSSSLDYSATVTVRQPLKLLIPITVTSPVPLVPTNPMLDVAPSPLPQPETEPLNQRTILNELQTATPASSPVAPGTPSSDGDELRDMFSILGLDEDEKWDSWKAKSARLNRSSSLEVKGSSTRKRRSSTARLTNRSLSSEGPAATGSAKKRSSTKQLQLDPADTSYALEFGPRYQPGEAWPTIKRKIHDSPISLERDVSPDELLLTRHGWEWEPTTS